jgi:hypothetical protein
LNYLLQTTHAFHNEVSYIPEKLIWNIKGIAMDEELFSPAPKYPQELIDWARKQVTEEEIIAGIVDIEQNGGFELREFIDELEQEALPRQ